jgi:anti-sigma regulatory factor (Ser/Thr protein kinase)
MSGSTADARFVHPALFYRSEDEYQAKIVPFVTDGLALGHPVAVSVPGPRLRLLRDALGDRARDVTMLDMTEEGRNPGRIIAGVLRRFADVHPLLHVRIVGEPVWPGRSDAEYPACAQHEALINAAFAGRDVTILCPYDAAGLDATALSDAYATHPVIWGDDGESRSDAYAPDDVIARYNQTLCAPADGMFLVVATPVDVANARHASIEHGRRLGLAGDRVRDLALIVTELVTNSIVHTAGPGRLGLWRADGHVICEVRDPGRFVDPLVGRHPADPEKPNGRGLLLVNDLADLVRMHDGPEGTVIRVYLEV